VKDILGEYAGNSWAAGAAQVGMCSTVLLEFANRRGKQ
jgi:hypothetical protein